MNTPSPAPRRILRRLGLLALVAAVGASSAACSKRSKAPNFARVDDEAVFAAKQPVNILDRDLRNRVAADIADAARMDDGRLRVRVNLRNSTRKDLAVEARVVFKDGAGLSTGDEVQWQPLFFSPQQIQTFTAVSFDNQARTFTVEVRRP